MDTYEVTFGELSYFKQLEVIKSTCDKEVLREGAKSCHPEVRALVARSNGVTTSILEDMLEDILEQEELWKRGDENFFFSKSEYKWLFIQKKNGLIFFIMVLNAILNSKKFEISEKNLSKLAKSGIPGAKDFVVRQEIAPGNLLAKMLKEAEGIELKERIYTHPNYKKYFSELKDNEEIRILTEIEEENEVTKEIFSSISDKNE